MKLTPVAIVLLASMAPLAGRAAVYSNGSSPVNLNVTLTIQANCVIATNPLNFGSTGVLAGSLDQTTTLSVTCTNTTPYNIGLDGGSVTGSTVSNRLLAGTTTGNTGTTVGFQLYQDAGRTVVWGNTQGTDTVSGTGNGAAQSYTVYGRVPPQATPMPDTYQATVLATVYY